MNLPEIGRELGLLVAAAGHVLVRGHDLAPRLQASGRLALDGGPGALPLFAPHLLVEDQPAQFHFHLVDFVRLRGGNGRQKPRNGIERAVGIIAGEWLLMRPAVAIATELH